MCGIGARGRQPPTRDRRPGRGSTARLQPTTREGVPTGEQRRNPNHRTAARTGAGNAGGRQEGRREEEGRTQARPEESRRKEKEWSQEGRVRQEGRAEEGRSQGRSEEEGSRQEGRRSEEGRGPQEGRRTQEGCCCRGSGCGVDAVGRSRFHEMNSCRSRLPSWSRARCKRAPSGALFSCGRT